MAKPSILVTGGVGYIGSQTCLHLLRAGHEVVVLDNLSNSSERSLDRVQLLAGQRLSFHKGDIRSVADLDSVFSTHHIASVIHFAGLKAVGESVEQPLLYYDNNIVGTTHLLHAMRKSGVFDLVFSSSCTVYGEPNRLPIVESSPIGAQSPYGRTKLFIEEMLRDVCRADPRWRVMLLRYFNPVGADSSGDIGEDPRGIPNNLMPYVMQVAVGRREKVGVFGKDYPTPDGTGVRDYIHVADLADGHLAALNALPASKGAVAVNLGTGRGYSVLEVITACERATGKTIPYEILPRRAGDVSAVYADPELAWSLLGWRATRDLDAMCRDAWNWQRKNPEGYADSSVASL